MSLPTSAFLETDFYEVYRSKDLTIQVSRPASAAASAPPGPIEKDHQGALLVFLVCQLSEHNEPRVEHGLSLVEPGFTFAPRLQIWKPFCAI